MAKWTKHEKKLKKDHGWRAKAGYNVFVADRGALRFDYPASWLVTPTEDAIEFRDRPEPDDRSVLKASVHYLNPDLDWRHVPIAKMVAELEADDPRGLYGQSPTHHETRGDLRIAWVENRFVDPNEKREAYARTAIAIRGFIWALLTMVMWPEDYEEMDIVWREALRTLQLGVPIADPTQGPVLH
jgi:hypothetical protein